MRNILKILLTILSILNVYGQSFGEIDFRSSSDGLMIFGNDRTRTFNLLKTTNGGEDWDVILSAAKLKAISQKSSQEIYIGYGSNGIAYTNDGGQSWSYEDFGETGVSVQKIEWANSNYGWVCGLENVFITTNSGADWLKVPVPGAVEDALSLDLFGVNKGLLLKENGDVFRFLPDSVSPSWELIGELGGTCYGNNAGFTFVDSLHGYAFGYRNAFRTTDGGVTWDELLDAKYKDIHGYHVRSKSKVWHAGERGIYYSDDSGESFFKQYENSTPVQSIDFVDGNNGWAVNDNGYVLKTTNGGANWNMVSGTSEFPPEIIGITDVPNDEGGFVELKFARSELDGLNNSEGLLRYDIISVINGSSVKIHSQQPESRALYVLELPSAGDSTAEGITFTRLIVKAVTTQGNIYSSGQKSGYSVDNLKPLPPDSFQASLGDGSVNLLWNRSQSSDVAKYRLYRSTENNFIPDEYSFLTETTDTSFEDEDLPSEEVSMIYYKIFSADSSGNFSADYSSVSVNISTTSTGEPELKKQYSLLQNYPNPFNPTTTIEFVIAGEVNHSVQTTLTIYDVLGSKVAVLINEELQSGNYKLSFDASHLPSGIYYYNITSGKFADTKKMLLLK